MRPNADDLMRFAATLEGVELSTAARGAIFTVLALPTGLQITPASSGESRLVSREMVHKVCEENQRLGSTRPVDYQAISFDASYLLALLQRYAEHQK